MIPAPSGARVWLAAGHTDMRKRELRAVAVGRKNWTFAGSDEGGQRAAAIYTLIATAKLNDVDPQAWLADVLARCWIIQRNGSATCCLGTGVPKIVLPPDTWP